MSFLHPPAEELIGAEAMKKFCHEPAPGYEGSWATPRILFDHVKNLFVMANSGVRARSLDEFSPDERLMAFKPQLRNYTGMMQSALIVSQIDELLLRMENFITPNPFFYKNAFHQVPMPKAVVQNVLEQVYNFLDPDPLNKHAAEYYDRMQSIAKVLELPELGASRWAGRQTPRTPPADTREIFSL